MEIIQNAIGFIRNKPVPPRITVDNKRYHIINLHNLTNIKNIGIIELHQILLCSMHMEVNNMIIDSVQDSYEEQEF